MDHVDKCQACYENSLLEVLSCLFLIACTNELIKILFAYVVTPIILVSLAVTCAPCKLIYCLLKRTRKNLKSLKNKQQ